MELCHLSEESGSQLLIFFWYDSITLDKFTRDLEADGFIFLLDAIKK